MNRTIRPFILPVTLLFLLLLAAGFGLTRISAQDGFGSALPDTKAPAFNRPEFSSADLKGQVSIVNFFASWCPPCEIEHPELIRLKNEHGIAIYGVNYKDSDSGRVDYLQRLGNPYTAITPDPNGELAALWRIQGVPETVIIDPAGHIRYRLSAPLTPQLIDATLLPLIRKLQR